MIGEERTTWVIPRMSRELKQRVKAIEDRGWDVICRKDNDRTGPYKVQLSRIIKPWQHISYTSWSTSNAGIERALRKAEWFADGFEINEWDGDDDV